MEIECVDLEDLDIARKLGTLHYICLDPPIVWLIFEKREVMLLEEPSLVVCVPISVRTSSLSTHLNS